MCLPPCDMLGIYFDLTNQCRRVFSAPSLLPEPIFCRRFDVFHSTSFVFFAAPELAQAADLSPILRTRASLPTSSNRLSWQTYLMSTLTCPSNIRVCHCGHTLLQVLSLVSTSEPRKPGLTMLPFDLWAICQSTPLLPSLRSHSRELFFHFKAQGFHE